MSTWLLRHHLLLVDGLYTMRTSVPSPSLRIYSLLKLRSPSNQGLKGVSWYHGTYIIYLHRQGLRVDQLLDNITFI